VWELYAPSGVCLSFRFEYSCSGFLETCEPDAKIIFKESGKLIKNPGKHSKKTGEWNILISVDGLLCCHLTERDEASKRNRKRIQHPFGSSQMHGRGIPTLVGL